MAFTNISILTFNGVKQVRINSNAAEVIFKAIEMTDAPSTGNSLINKTYLDTRTFDGSQFRLANNQPLRARNAADTADINLFRLDTSNVFRISNKIEADVLTTAVNYTIGDQTPFSTIRSMKFSVENQVYTLVGDFTSGSNLITNIVGSLPSYQNTPNYAAYAAGYTSESSNFGYESPRTISSFVDPTTIQMQDPAIKSGTGVTFYIVPLLLVSSENQSQTSSPVAILSGNSTSSSSGFVFMGPGDATPTPSTVLMQGITYNSGALRSEANLYSAQTVIDATLTPITSGYVYVGNVTSGSNILSSMSSTTGLTIGMNVAGTGIPANTTVTQIISANSVRMSANATATNTGVNLTFRNLLSSGNVYLVTNYAAGDDFSNIATYTRPNCVTSIGLNTVTVSSQSGFLVGMSVSGTGIPGGTTVTAILSPTSIQISNNATASGTVTLTFTYVTNATGAIFRATGTIANVWSNGSTLQPIVIQGLGNRILNRVPSGLISDQLHTAQRATYFVSHDFDTLLTTPSVIQTADAQYLSGAIKVGDTVIGNGNTTSWTNIDTPVVNLTAPNANNTVTVRTSDTRGSTPSGTLVVGSGRPGATGNSGGLTLFTATPNGTGASGNVQISTGGVRGSLQSGNLVMVTGGTNALSNANTGVINLISGSVNGTGGNTGNVFVGSGNITQTATSGVIGQAQLFSGSYSGNGTVTGGLVFVGGGTFSGNGSGTTSSLSMRSGDKTGTGSSGNTGTVTLRSGNHSGISGSSGNLTINSGDLYGDNTGGASGNATLNSGNITSPLSTGGTGSITVTSGDNSGSGNSGAARLSSGSVQTGSSGDANIWTGNVNAGSNNSGSINIFTGSSVGGVSGQINITSGNQSGIRNAGNLNINAGFVVDGTTGMLSVTSGYASGNGSTGPAGFGSGTVNGTGSSGYTGFSSGGATNGGSSGQTDLRTGNASLGSGQIVIQTGSAGTVKSGDIGISTGVSANAESGSIFISSGVASGSQDSGFITVKPGAVAQGDGGNFTGAGGNNGGTAGNGGQANIRGGDINGANIGGVTGWVNVTSGDVTNVLSTASSAEAVFKSGDVAGSGISAQVLIRSGNTASAISGPVNINSGNVNGGVSNSGNINIATGSSSGGIRGSVNITGHYVNLTSQPGGNIHLYTETNGAVAFFANGILKSSIQTGNQSPYGVAINSALMASQQNANNNIGVLAGNDAGGASQGGNLLLAAGFGGVASQPGGSVHIHSGGSSAGYGGDVNITANGLGANKGMIVNDSNGYQVKSTDYVSMNAVSSIILNHGSSGDGVQIVNGGTIGSGDIGIDLRSNSSTLYGHPYNGIIQSIGHNDKIHLAVKSSNDTATSGAAGDLTLAAGAATNGSNNGGNIFLESGSSTGGVGGEIRITANGTGVNKGDVNVYSKRIQLQPDTDVRVLSPLEIRGASEVKYYNTANTQYTALKAQPGATSSVTFQLPQTDGSNNQAVVTNGSGVLGFLSVLPLSGGTMSGAINMGTFGITNAANPNNPQDVATKYYVDAVATGLGIRATVKAATTAALPAYNPSGNILTATSNGALPLIDTYSFSPGERILVKNESGSNKKYNGIYDVTAVGDGSNPFVLTRSSDYDGSPITEVKSGSFTFVEEGSVNRNVGFVQILTVTTINSDDLEFAQFSAAGSYSAGNGITISGQTIAVNYGRDLTNNEGSSNIALRDFVYMDGAGTVKLVIADGTISTLSSATQYGISRTAGSVAPAGTANITFKSGDVIGGFSGLVVGSPVYASRTVAGGYQQNLTGFVSGNQVIRLGHAISSTELHFEPAFEFEY